MRDGRAETVALACATLLPFVATMLYVESVFYEVGAVYNDAGLFAQVIYRNDLWLSMRAAFAEAPLPYFHTHLTFFMWPLALLSRVLPVGMVQFISLFHAALIAIVAGVGYRATFLAFGSRLAAVPAAWLLAFSGLCVHTSWNPHFEIVIPALMVATVMALFQKQEKLGLALLFALFLTREDAPFQFVLLWGSLTFLCPQRSPEERASAIRILRLAIALGIILFAFQSAFFPPRPVFEMEYSGRPPWAHLTSDVIAERLGYLWGHRVDVWGPLLLVLIGGLVLREPVLIAATVAATPWFLLHLSASFEGMARFAIHYGFPFVATLLAPSLAMIRDLPERDHGRALRLGALQVAVLVVASVRADARPPIYALSPPLGHYGHRTDGEVVRQTERLLDHLQAQARAGSLVCASDSVASLRTDLVAHRERIRAVTEARADCDYIVSFRRDHEAVAVAATRALSESETRCLVSDTYLVVDRPGDVAWPFRCAP